MGMRQSRFGFVPLGVLATALLVGCGPWAETPQGQEVQGQEPRTAGSQVTQSGSGHTEGIQTQRSGWHRGEDFPLPWRDQPVVTEVDGKVLVVGGVGGPPCPRTASCLAPMDQVRSDGALFDPRTGSWTPIADAPEPLRWGAAVSIGTDVYLATDRALYVWHAVSDTWQTVRTFRRHQYAQPVADGSRLLLVRGTNENGVRPDLTYHPASGAWGRLPVDPFGVTGSRSVTATPDGLVLGGNAIEADDRPSDPPLVHAALLAPGARAWQPFEVAPVLGNENRFAWTGERLVLAALGGGDGGATGNYGRFIPYAGALDPSTGKWSLLTDVPDANSAWTQDSRWWPVEEVGGARSATGTWVYDDTARTWRRLTRPDGAPTTPGPATWVEDALVVVGGITWPQEGGAATSGKTTVSQQVWTLRP